MSFKVTARTLLHLGAELISSDSIALFELVKNAFDARSENGVTIVIVAILPGWPARFTYLMRSLGDAEYLLKLERSSGKDRQAALALLDEALSNLRREIMLDFDASAPGSSAWVESVRTADIFQLKRLIADANTIVVRDTGKGMSLDDLRDVFLTIGTPTKLQEKQNWIHKHPNDQPPVILGEKGIGRLSVMRLGDVVQIKTSKKGEKNWNLLQIDWRIFTEDQNALLESIKIAPTLGAAKDVETDSGTEIRISLLHSQWSAKILEDFAVEEVSKLNDPFDIAKRYLVKLFFNESRIFIPTLEKNLGKFAHAYVSAKLIIERSNQEISAQLVGRAEYRLRGNRTQVFSLEKTDLLSVTGLLPMQVADLGSISMEAYWFNRQLLQSVEENGIKIRDLVNKWSGGLMLFRDGFRVFPYGSADDDWLGLDAKALSSGGYKVNRKQIVGRVNISSYENPRLKDQANREGLVDCPESEALKVLLKFILESQLRQFLNAVDKEMTSRIDLDFTILSKRVGEEKDSLQLNLDFLKSKFPAIRNEREIMANISQSIERLEELMVSAQSLADSFEAGRSQLVHLAALGLTVEMLAHELNRTTRYALGYLEEARTAVGNHVPAIFKAIESQLITIQKRLSVLDPESISGRQTKALCNIKAIAETVFESHYSTLERLGIPVKNVIIRPKDTILTVKMVKGMLTQILDNLIDNSIYWLRQEKILNPTFSPEIEIEIDSEKRTIIFSDNGPGIDDELRDKVFEPFFTRKPPGKGKGLGLYIVSELVKYHDASIELTDEKRIHPGRLNSFLLTLPKK